MSKLIKAPTTRYKGRKDSPAFECEYCGTIWKDEWVDAEQKGWCPSCHRENIPNCVVKRDSPKNKVACARISKELESHKINFELKMMNEFGAESSNWVRPCTRFIDKMFEKVDKS